MKSYSHNLYLTIRYCYQVYNKNYKNYPFPHDICFHDKSMQLKINFCRTTHLVNKLPYNHFFITHYKIFIWFNVTSIIFTVTNLLLDHLLCFTLVFMPCEPSFTVLFRQKQVELEVLPVYTFCLDFLGCRRKTGGDSFGDRHTGPRCDSSIECCIMPDSIA